MMNFDPTPEDMARMEDKKRVVGVQDHAIGMIKAQTEEEVRKYSGFALDLLAKHLEVHLARVKEVKK